MKKQDIAPILLSVAGLIFFIVGLMNKQEIYYLPGGLLILASYFIRRKNK